MRTITVGLALPRGKFKFVCVTTIGLIAAVLLVAWVGQGRCQAATVTQTASAPAKPAWLVKTGDADRFAAQAQTDGLTLSAWTFDACGGPYNWPCNWIGAPAQISATYAGVLRIARVHDHVTIFYDLEGWLGSPNTEKANPLYWLCRAAKTIRAMNRPGVRLVETPVGHTAAMMQAEDVEAVRCGSWGVDMQSQFADGKPKLFQSVINADVDAMRDVRPAVYVLAGIATNGPEGFLSVATLVRDYWYAVWARVNGIWLNGADWTPKNRCGAAQGGPGCPEIAVRMLQAIGAAH